MNALRLLLLGALLVLAGLRPAQGAELVAFSLRQAEAAVRGNTPAAAEARRMAGITRIVAAVVDERSAEVIVVGEREPRQPAIALDDLVVALRARLLHQQWPFVSIDRTADTARTGRQVVRFESGSATRTRFHGAMLAADVALKRIALDLASAEIWGVPSYFGLCLRAAAENRLEERVSSRFWFRPLDASQIVVREGTVVVQHFRLGVDVEVLSVNGNSPGSDARDKLGDRFAARMTERLPELAGYFPEIGRLGRLFELVALARGLEMQQRLPSLDYWLKSYAVAEVDTPATYPLLKRSEKVSAGGGQRTLEIDGGVEMRAAAARLADGDVTALRQVVLRARPEGNALSWRVPVDARRAQNAALALATDAAALGRLSRPGDGDAGTSISRYLSAPPSQGTTRMPPPPLVAATPPSMSMPAAPRLAPAEPSLRVNDRLPNWTTTQKVGGVMLASVASLKGAAPSAVSLGEGGFGLVVEGENARLAPEEFRRFVTALWAVYFSDQAPGISIDPIAPGVERHAVRYIGNVVNTDLARVMRVADYRMKGAVVGSDPIDVPGWHDIDDLAALHGMPPLHVMRRFWFVPDYMRFKRAGGTLMFDGGRMALKTEVMAPGMRGTASAADKALTSFFTANYEAIAARYPVYRELFDYAKHVSLANFVKEQKAPLLWFLLANKHLVLTEDSPGTVQALARDSRYRPELKITGGVNMRAPVRYVQDAGLAQAVGQALAQARELEPSPTVEPGPPGRSGPAARAAIPSGPTEPRTFSSESSRYTAIPDQWLSSGDTARGLRFQTDLALREGNLPGLELVRVFDPADAAGEFGPGWRVMVPYRVQAVGDETVDFRNARLRKKMVVLNRLTGRSEALTFSADRYAIAGYVPEDISASEFVGLFVLTDGSFRLADKLGGEYVFDPSGALTAMIVADGHAYAFEYLAGIVRAPADTRVRVEPDSEAKVRWQGLVLPQRLRLSGIGERAIVMRFTDQRGFAGYEPDSEGAGQIRFAAVLSDGSLRVAAADGNEWVFRPDGSLEGVLPDRRLGLVSAMQSGKQRVELHYALNEQVRPHVARASVKAGEGANGIRRELVYRYDAPGRLAAVQR